MARIKSGNTYARLTAIGPCSAKGRWLFSCSCGAETEKRTDAVLSGATKSCGCLHMERCKTGLNRLRHGDAKVGKVARLHGIWRGVLKRCGENYPDHAGAYRARGITVCDEWKDYATFKAWAETHGYRDDLSIDRIDNNAGYSPENCRWATKTEQARNRRTSHHITVNGRTQVLAAWLEETGVSRSAFHSRVMRGWPKERALFPL